MNYVFIKVQLGEERARSMVEGNRKGELLIKMIASVFALSLMMYVFIEYIFFFLYLNEIISFEGQTGIKGIYEALPYWLTLILWLTIPFLVITYVFSIIVSDTWKKVVSNLMYFVLFFFIFFKAAMNEFLKIR